MTDVRPETLIIRLALLAMSTVVGAPPKDDGGGDRPIGLALHLAAKRFLLDEDEAWMRVLAEAYEQRKPRMVMGMIGDVVAALDDYMDEEPDCDA